MLKTIKAWLGFGATEDTQPHGIHGFDDLPLQNHGDIDTTVRDVAAPTREDVLGKRYCAATDKVDTAVADLRELLDSESKPVAPEMSGTSLVSNIAPTQVLSLSPETVALLGTGFGAPAEPTQHADVPADSAWVRGTVVQLTDVEQKQLFNSTRMRRNRSTRNLEEAAEYARGVVAEVMRRREAVDATWDTAPALTDVQQLEFDVVYAQAKLAGLDADACRHRAYFAAYRLGDAGAVRDVVGQLIAA